MSRRARLTVDLDALAANHALLIEAAAGAEVAPVVKADAYGLGAGPVARRLWREGARTFFVARIEEGEALREILPKAAIHVLDGAAAGDVPRLIAAGLIPVLGDTAQAAAYGAHGRTGAPLPCGLQMDTGMNRLGLRLEELQAMAQSPDRLAGLEVGLVMSHLACAEDPDNPMNARQAERFRGARRLFPDARASLANSAGTFLDGPYTLDMVRPGITLYGGGPRGRTDRSVKAVATLEAPIIQVRNVPAGETVGYGAAYRAEAVRRVAIVGAGYADGVLRASSPGGAVWFGGARRPLLGRVSMDLIAVDVTGCDAAAAGAMVEIIGPNLPLDEAAAAAGTIAYEVLTRIGPRVERIYLGG